MGRQAGSIIVGAALTAATFGIGAIAVGANIFTQAAIGFALGAAMGGLGLLLAEKGPKRAAQKEGDINVTTSIRNLPVPVAFGRCRVAGNFLRLGTFFRVKTKRNDNGGRVYLIHAIIGLCEGPIKYWGNVRQDGKTLQELAEEVYEGDPDRFNVDLMLASDDDAGLPDVSGSDVDIVPTVLTGGVTNDDGDLRAYFDNVENPVPWRNTAKVFVDTCCGYQPSLVSINGDLVGPDFCIRRTASTSGSNFGESIAIGWTANTLFYDAYTQRIYYTVSGCTAISEPWGLMRIHRFNAAGHQHTAPPTAVTDSVTKAWYLGRHDILVMQDPNVEERFWVGYWGISRASSEWKFFTPHPDYQVAITADHLDEMSGILHTYHYGGAGHYIMRWNLLTGRVDKIEVANTDTVTAFMYSPDFHCYIFATDDGVNTHLIMADPETGDQFHDTTTPTMTLIRGLCVSGSRIGIIRAGAFLYYNPDDGSVSDVYGSSSTNPFVEGALGGIVLAAQNTWTCQIIMARYSVEQASLAFNMCIPSVPEDLEDVSANGSPDETEFQFTLDDLTCEPEIDVDLNKDWCRDWCWRTYGAFSQVTFDGRSSVAAAAFASLVDYKSIDPTIDDLDGVLIDTARWGAGVHVDLVSMQSFEALHAYCVGAIKFKSPQRTFSCTSSSSSSSSSSLSPGDQYCADYIRITIGGTLGPGNCACGEEVLGTFDLYPTTPPQGHPRAWGDDTWILYGDSGLWKLGPRCSEAPYCFRCLNTCPSQDEGNWHFDIISGQDCLKENLLVLVKLERFVVEGGAASSSESGGVVDNSVERYAERAKFDYFMDSEQSADSFLMNAVLPVVNGYVYFRDGMLHVGVNKPGGFPVWHFTEDEIMEDSAQIQYAARRGGTNRIRVQFTHVRDEYRKDFAEWNDEAAQNAIGRVRAETLSIDGIARHGHAEWIAKQIGDQLTASRRTLTFKTHYVAKALAVNDLIEVTHASLGLTRDKFKIVQIQEQDDGSVGVTAQEHRPVLENLRDEPPSPAPLKGPDDNGQTEPGFCENVEGSTGTGVVWFNGGAVYGPGDYTIGYITGAYKFRLDGGYAVEGYDLVYKDALSGGIVVIMECPAVANPDGGWDTAAAAIAANNGQIDAFTFNEVAPIGIHLRYAPKYTNGDEGNPVYELCLDQSGAGSGTGGNSGSGDGSDDDGSPGISSESSESSASSTQPPGCCVDGTCDEELNEAECILAGGEWCASGCANPCFDCTHNGTCESELDCDCADMPDSVSIQVAGFTTPWLQCFNGDWSLAKTGTCQWTLEDVGTCADTPGWEGSTSSISISSACGSNFAVVFTFNGCSWSFTVSLGSDYCLPPVGTVLNVVPNFCISETDDGDATVTITGY